MRKTKEYGFSEMQVTVIKNLAQEEGKDTKAFLKQQPFAKPGDKKYFLL